MLRLFSFFTYRNDGLGGLSFDKVTEAKCRWYESTGKRGDNASGEITLNVLTCIDLPSNSVVMMGSHSQVNLGSVKYLMRTERSALSHNNTHSFKAGSSSGV